MLVVARGLPSVPKELFTLIALFAVTNTALINFIMGSRILYGMTREGLAPPVIARVHGNWGTPQVAILVTLLSVVTLTSMEGLEVLAQSTSLLLLSVFLMLNLSLIVIKSRSKGLRPTFQVPVWIPILGAAACPTLIFFVNVQAFITVLILVLIGSMIYLDRVLGEDKHERHACKPIADHTALTDVRDSPCRLRLRRWGGNWVTEDRRQLPERGFATYVLLASQII